MGETLAKSAFYSCFALLMLAFGLTQPIIAGERTPVTENKPQTTQESKPDVAVNSLVQVGPPFATQGASVTFQIGVSNNGAEEATFKLTLSDDTESKVIASTSVTLAAGSTSTVELVWNTTGASGGPPPPGPPTPGTIHALTASADLEGDSEPGNDSASLLPGIWIIAAPSKPEITYPDPLQEPQAKLGYGLALESPTVATPAEYLSNIFASETDGKNRGSVVAISISTESENLPGIFHGQVGGRRALNLSYAGPPVLTQPLTTIFNSAAHSHMNLRLDKPTIETALELPEDIPVEEVPAKHLKALEFPTIGTQAEPLARVFSDESTIGANRPLTSPDIGTEGRPLSVIYRTPVLAESTGQMTPSDTNVRLDAEKEVISFPGVVPVEIVPLPTLPPPDIGTLLHPLVQEAVTTYRPVNPLSRPFSAAIVRGKISLQGRHSSLGSYVAIGNKITFVDRDGSFKMEAPQRRFDIKLMAPGYLTVTITDNHIEAGQSLNLPQVTLTFGDVNADGVVDIYDLAVAAGNFGATSRAEPEP